DAKVRFQNLEFRLAPAQKGFESQALVTISGDGSCTFENCLITMADPQDCHLYAVVFADPGTVMPGKPRPAVVPPGPFLSFERCFVCGLGDLAWCRASRPFRLKAQDTLAVLSGSVLVVDAGNYEDASDTRSEVEFRRVTAAVENHVLLLRKANEDLKGIVPIS